MMWSVINFFELSLFASGYVAVATSNAGSNFKNTHIIATPSRTIPHIRGVSLNNDESDEFDHDIVPSSERIEHDGNNAIHDIFYDNSSSPESRDEDDGAKINSSRQLQFDFFSENMYEKQNRSEESFGWKPAEFPNPINEPERCGIPASLLSETENSQKNDHKLFFCDPDSILNASSKSKVLYALRNFTASKYAYSVPCNDADRLNNRYLKKSSNRYSGISTNNRSLMRLDLRHLLTFWDVISDEDSRTSSSDRQKKEITDVSAHTVFYPDADQNEISPDAGDDQSVFDDFVAEVIQLASGSDDFSSFKSTRNLADENNVTASNYVDVNCDKEQLESTSIPIRLAVAAVRKIDLQAILRADSYYSYEDENDMVNDAAQYFARYVHDTWDLESDSDGETGILIFLSIEDRVCYVSSGHTLSAMLPWWRLESITDDIRPELQVRAFGDAIVRAIGDVGILLETGPPTLSDRLSDFMSRFGLVLGFALITLVFAVMGEYQERRRRWTYTELRSKLSTKEKEEARLLQKEYDCMSCPICLENFSKGKKTITIPMFNFKVNGNDDVPFTGSDGLPLKLLRCGHVFDESCWKSWVNSGQGNPLKCPICRQDVGGKCRDSGSDSNNIHNGDQGQATERTLLFQADNLYGSTHSGPHFST